MATMQMLRTSVTPGQRSEKAIDFHVLRWAATLTLIGSALAIGMLGLLAEHGGSNLFYPDGLFQRGGSRITDLRVEDTDCAGRRVYIYDLPPQFNEEVLQTLGATWWYSFKDYCINEGLGKRLEHVMEPMEAWYRTEQYLVEPTIHERFKQYRCLTNNPDVADLLYLPYYAGADFCYTKSTDMMQLRDRLVQRLVGWLAANPAWVRSQGRKHLMVLGRNIGDLSRPVGLNGWGNSLLANTELQNVTTSSLERDLRFDNPRQLTMPYPTSFHPASDAEIELWSKTIRESKRDKLVSFVGGPRNATKVPKMRLRDVLFEQCESSELCETLRCDKTDCRMNPEVVTKVFLKSHFCLQPPGDSPTRKGTFDCLVAGAIPVFFSPDSAYRQYHLHLPVNGSSYSVLIEQNEVMDSTVNVIDILSKIPKSRIDEMHNFISNEVMPRVVYDMPGAGRSRNSEVKDAFDILVEHFFNSSFQAYP